MRIRIAFYAHAVSLRMVKKLKLKQCAIAELIEWINCRKIF